MIQIHHRTAGGASNPHALAGMAKRIKIPLLRMYSIINAYTQRYRVANDSLERYELNIGTDQAPDLNAAPDETSATLPFDHALAAPPSGTRTYHCLVRKRNKYNMVSLNQYATQIEVDSAGDEDYGPLTAPLDISVFASDTEGSAIVTATYAGIDRNKPTHWKIWTTEGSDPDPDIDSPDVSEAMTFVGGRSYIQAEITGATPGATLHVIVGVYRDDDTDQATADAETLDLPEAPDISSSTANAIY